MDKRSLDTNREILFCLQDFLIDKPWIIRKSDSIIGVSPLDPFRVTTSFWLLVLTASAYDTEMLVPASSACFVPSCSACLPDHAFV